MKWFKHDTDANQDAKLQNVLLDYGLEGYGLYWYCIELIAGNISEDNLNFHLEHDARIIARNTGSTPQKVEEMMRYFVALGLFEDSDGTITCLKLRNRLNKSMTSNPVIRKMITNDKVESSDYSGYLYFIHAKNGDVSKIKIGRSKNPHARLNDLKRRKDCLGFELSLIHAIKSDNCVELETEYHRIFKNDNLVNEWFAPSESLISHLNDALRVDYDLTTILQIRLDKNRREEKRIEKELCAHSEECFEKVWRAYPTKIGKQKAKALFLNYVKKEKVNRSVFTDHLIDDINERCRVKQFGFDKLHFTTYMNQKRWEDPIPLPDDTTERNAQRLQDFNFTDEELGA